ncbi:MAG: ComEC/Rec2 family competence protein [Bacteroidota bacterium]
MSSFNSGISFNAFFVKILIPFIFGIFTFYTLSFSLIPWLKAVCIALATLLFFFNLCYSKTKIYKNKIVISWIIYVFVFLIAGLNTLSYNEQSKSTFFAKWGHDFLKVRVMQDIRQTNNIVRIKARVIQSIDKNEDNLSSGYINLAIRIASPGSFKVEYGDHLIIPAKYRSVEEQRNPNTFNYKNWLAAQNIYHESFLFEREVIKTGTNSGNTIIKYALKLRQEQIHYFKSHLKAPGNVAFTAALILGSREELDKDLLNVYIKTGVVHALSVSGMHVGLIYLLLNFLLRSMDKKKYLKLIKFCLIFFVIWFYTILSGLSPSALRSAIMLSVYLIGVLLNRTASGYSTLSFTALIMLLHNPYLIWDVGFELSFVAVFGLTLLYSPISSWIYSKNRIVTVLWNTLSISASAQLTTYPLSIYYFHLFPNYFLFSNLIISIPICILMYGGIFILIFRLTFLIPIFEWVVNVTNACLEYIAELPGASWTGIWISRPELLILYAAIILFSWSLLYASKKLLIASLGFIMVFQLSSIYSNIVAQNQKKIIIYSLNNQYAAAFIKGKNAFLVTSLTRSDPLYIKQVLPFLDQQMVDSILIIKNHEDFNSKYFNIRGNGLSFCSYRMSRLELINLKIDNNKAIIQDID